MHCPECLESIPLTGDAIIDEMEICIPCEFSSANEEPTVDVNVPAWVDSLA